MRFEGIVYENSPVGNSAERISDSLGDFLRTVHQGLEWLDGSKPEFGENHREYVDTVIGVCGSVLLSQVRHGRPLADSDPAKTAIQELLRVRHKVVHHIGDDEGPVEGQYDESYHLGHLLRFFIVENGPASDTGCNPDISLVHHPERRQRSMKAAYALVNLLDETVFASFAGNLNTSEHDVNRLRRLDEAYAAAIDPRKAI